MENELTPQAKAVSIVNITYKFAGYSSVLLIADFLIKGLFPTIWSIFAVSLSLTVVGAIADLTIVPRYGNIPSLALGFFGMVLIIWAVPRFWTDSHITLFRAAVMAIFIGPLEYALHRYVLRNLFIDRPTL
jgi:hypothetical protein